MKIRNKKSGEIIEVYVVNNQLKFKRIDNGKQSVTISFETLAELNAEWEDYKEPKKWWYIDIDGEVKQGEGNVPEHLIGGMKQIGNYFENKDEAKKARDKLKA